VCADASHSSTLNFNAKDGDTLRGCASLSGTIDAAGKLSWTTHSPMRGNTSVYTDDCFLSGNTITGGAGINLKKVS
jgi:hypothetical protein